MGSISMKLNLSVPVETTVVSYADDIPSIAISKLLKDMKLYLCETVTAAKAWKVRD